MPDFKVKVTVDCDSEGRCDSQIANFVFSAIKGQQAFYVEYLLMPYTQMDTLAWHFWKIQNKVREITKDYFEFSIDFKKDIQTPILKSRLETRLESLEPPNRGSRATSKEEKANLVDKTDLYLPTFFINIKNVDGCDCGTIGERIHLYQTAGFIPCINKSPSVVEKTYHYTWDTFSNYPRQSEESWPIFAVVNKIVIDPRDPDKRRGAIPGWWNYISWTPLKASIEDVIRAIASAPRSVRKHDLFINNQWVKEPTSEPSSERFGDPPEDKKIAENDLYKYWKNKYETEAREIINMFLKKQLKLSENPVKDQPGIVRAIREYLFKNPPPSGRGR